MCGVFGQSCEVLHVLGDREGSADRGDGRGASRVIPGIMHPDPGRFDDTLHRYREVFDDT